MFELKTNEAIGAHLGTLITNQYGSQRQFCVQYLKRKNLPSDGEMLQNLQNRFSQICNGNKSIQTYDLPVVTELLGVSCEEILSAGEVFVPTNSHITNYSIAHSKDPDEWESYINRPDKLILNYDEYGKSVLDYAYEFKNYGFLKYLFKKGYIRLRDSSDQNIGYDFGAVTTIKRREVFDQDILGSRLEYSDTLRMYMISLAMENKDFTILDEFKARETPMFASAAVYINTPKEPEHFDYKKLVKLISSSPDETIKYFTEEYEVIVDEKSSLKVFYLYQYLGEVIEQMVMSKDARVISVIDSAIAHNNKVAGRIKAIENNALKTNMVLYHMPKEKAINTIIRFSTFYDNCNVLRFYCHGVEGAIVSNIICAKAKTNDTEIASRLDALNTSFNYVKALIKTE